MYRILLFLVFALAVAFFVRETPDVIVFENSTPETSIIIAESPTPLPSPEEVRRRRVGRTSENERVETKEPIIPTQQQIIPSPTPTPPTRIAENVLYERGLEATVNLICRQKDNKFSVATGAIIHKSGYIISNAHIADDLADPPRCTVGRGPAARKFGEVKLVFLPKAYGESKTETERAHHDISLWKLEDANTVGKFWEIDFASSMAIGEHFLTQSYPAELLSSELFNADLNLLFSSTEVVNADEYLIEAKSSLASQRGSSGGILIDRFTGKIRGIIFGIDNTNTRQINERKLYALTPKTIDETVQKETGKTLTEYFASNP